MRRKGLQQDLFKGKLKPDDVKKMGYTDDQVREIISGKKLLPGESWGDFSGAGFPKIKILGKGELTDDEVNRIATERKKRGEAEKSAQELYMRAVEERKSAEHDQARARIEDSMKIIESTQSETQAAKESLNVVLLSMEERAAGIAKIQEEEKREIEQRSTYTDEKSGAVRHFKLNASTLETIHKATAERLAAFDMKFNEEESRRLEQMWKAAAARSQKMFERLYLEPMKQNLYVWEQESQWQDKIDDQGRSAAIAAVDQRKNLQLAQLESVDARTLQDKVALENAKTAIEVQAMKDRTKIELEEIDARTERQVDEARKAAMAQGIFYDARLDQIGNKIRELGQHEKGALQKATTAEIDVAQIKGATSTRKLVTDQYQSIFQSLKQQAGGVFDALVTKSQSVWSAIGNSLKTALLTAIKDVVTSRVAAMLMNLFVPGANVQMQQGGIGGKGGGGGLFGGLGGILGIGAVPVFAGGAPGGTPPFLPSGGAGAGGWQWRWAWVHPAPHLRLGRERPLPRRDGGRDAAVRAVRVRRRCRHGCRASSRRDLLEGGLGGHVAGPQVVLRVWRRTRVDRAAGAWPPAAGSASTDRFGDKLQALGKSDAALMGGALLAMDGLRRGGKTRRRGDHGGRRADRVQVRRSLGRGHRRHRRSGRGHRAAVREGRGGEGEGEDQGALRGRYRGQGRVEADRGYDQIRVRRQHRHGDPVAPDPRPDPVVRHDHRPEDDRHARHRDAPLAGRDGRVAVPVAAVQQRHPAPGSGWPAGTRPDRRGHSVRWRAGDSTRRARHDRAAPGPGGPGHRGQPAIGPERDDGRDQIEREPARAHQPSVEPRNA